MCLSWQVFLFDTIWQFIIEIEGMGESHPFQSLSDLIKAVMKRADEANSSLLLKRILPPSDYDKPELLLLAADLQNLKDQDASDTEPKVISRAVTFAYFLFDCIDFCCWLRVRFMFYT